MFERIMAFIKELPGGDGRGKKLGFSEEDPRLAVAAVMMHVINSDGVRHEKELQRLSDLLAQAYGLKGRDLQSLIDAAQTADQEAMDLYRFTTVLKRHLDGPARLHFIEVLWEMVYADGEVGEIEDSTMWRIADLIDVDEQQRVAVKQRVVGRLQNMKSALSSLRND